MKLHSPHSLDSRRVHYTAVVVVGVLVLGWLFSAVFFSVGQRLLLPVYEVMSFGEADEPIPEAVIALLQDGAPASSTTATEARLRQENQALRTLLHAPVSPRTVAGVIARPPALPYDVLVIDQGSEAGIAVGAPVYADAQTVIGMVSQVAGGSALVTLISTPTVLTSAYLAEANVLVELEGIGSGIARVRVPQGIDLQPGMTAYLPGIQPGLFGQVVYVQSTPTQPQQFGYIALPTPLQQLRYVGVGRVSDVRTSAPLVEAYVADIQQRLQLPDIAVPTTISTSTASTTDVGAPAAVVDAAVQ